MSAPAVDPLHYARGPDQTPASVLSWLLRRREVSVGALLLAMVLIVTLKNPSFLSLTSVRDMAVQCAPAAIVGCGLTLVIVMGEIDISVGSLMGLLAALVGILTSPQHVGWPVWLAVLATLGLGTGVGVINGLLVSFGRVPSIIVTLGMLTALRGVTELVMGGEWITDLPPNLRLLGTGQWLGVPICVWTAAVVVCATILFARRTPIGLRIYAVGSNLQAARLAGLSDRRLKLLVFGLTGFLTAVATLVSAPQLSVIESGVGVGFELLAVTCVVVGGTSIRGGVGGILGTLLATLLLGTVRTALVFLPLGDMAVYWERSVQGAFILAAVIMDHLAGRGGAPVRRLNAQVTRAAAKGGG